MLKTLTPDTVRYMVSNTAVHSQSGSKIANRGYYKTPFGEYFRILSEIDKGQRNSKEFGSMMILMLVEEIGEMSRAYLAEHGRKPNNLAAQADETYVQEMGDILVTILRFARIKKINLHDQVMYSLQKIEKRRAHPKGG